MFTLGGDTEQEPGELKGQCVRTRKIENICNVLLEIEIQHAFSQ